MLSFAGAAAGLGGRLGCPARDRRRSGPRPCRVSQTCDSRIGSPSRRSSPCSRCALWCRAGVLSRVPVPHAQGRRPRQAIGRRRVRQMLVVRTDGYRRRAARGGWFAAEKLRPADAGARGHRAARVLTLGSRCRGPLAGRARGAGFFSRLLDRVSALPGVRVGRGHGTAARRCVSATGASTSKDDRGSTAATAAPPTGTSSTPGYFETLGVRVVRGRAPAASDDEGAAASVCSSTRPPRARSLPTRIRSAGGCR